MPQPPETSAVAPGSVRLRGGRSKPFCRTAARRPSGRASSFSLAAGSLSIFSARATSLISRISDQPNFDGLTPFAPSAAIAIACPVAVRMMRLRNSVACCCNFRMSISASTTLRNSAGDSRWADSWPRSFAISARVTPPSARARAATSSRHDRSARPAAFCGCASSAADAMARASFRCPAVMSACAGVDSESPAAPMDSATCGDSRQGGVTRAPHRDRCFRQVARVAGSEFD